MAKKKGGKKKLKKTSTGNGAAMMPPGSLLPPIQTDVRFATLQSTIINHDSNSLSRLVSHYGYKNDLAKGNTDGSTLAHIAVKTNDLMGMQKLLSFGIIDVNAQEQPLLGGHSAIQLACLNNRPAILECLLQNGGNPNQKADSAIGETALMICCKLGHLTCAQILLKNAASMDILDNFGNNASFWAYRHDHTTMARELALPASHTPNATQFLQLQMQKIPGFVLPAIKKKVPKKVKGGDKAKKKK
jgi:hypothetical protein